MGVEAQHLVLFNKETLHLPGEGLGADRAGRGCGALPRAGPYETAVLECQFSSKNQQTLSHPGGQEGLCVCVWHSASPARGAWGQRGNIFQ